MDMDHRLVLLSLNLDDSFGNQIRIEDFSLFEAVGSAKADCRQLPAWRSGRGPRTPRRTRPVSCPGAWPGCARCPSPLSSDEGP